MTLKEALIQKLLSMSAITNIVGNRIRPNLSPQKETEPRLVVEASGADPMYDTTGSSGFQITQVTVTAYGTTQKAAADLAEIVRRNLGGMARGYLDNDNTIRHSGIFCRDIRDVYTPPQDGGQIGFPAVQLDFDILHSVET